ncbi:gram-negative bacterial tonB protein [mine drainage metagenome]|uniref:Gram-negative bacterial tonB protein n=1 Tax=mine drainage metagenome TaxID=410659 RepID=A0A1J5R3X7_9ZZZZ
MRSLQKQLIFWLVGLLTVVGMPAGAVSFYFALQEANRLLDHQLSQIARSVDEGSQLPAMQARFRRENEAAAALHFAGRVRVEFHLLDGVPSVAQVLVTSGIGLFDHAALRTVRSAHYPAPPADLRGVDRVYRVSVEFRR